MADEARVGIRFHKHHLVPKHVGGDCSHKNLIKVNVAMHAFLHKCLWEEFGRWQDRIAWQVLSGMISKEQGRIQAVSESSRQRWKTNAAYRDKVIASHGTEKSRKRKSEIAIEQWSRPEFQAKFKSGQVRRWSDPQEHVRMSQLHKGKRHAAGYRHTPEALKKIADAAHLRKGEKRGPMSEQAKAAIRAGLLLRSRRMRGEAMVNV